MQNCGNINKPKTRVYNYLAGFNLFKDPPAVISDDTVFWPKHFVKNTKLYFYTTPEGNLVFEKPKGPPLSWETYVNRELRSSLAQIYGMNLPDNINIVEFVYPKEGLTKYIDSYIKFNDEVLERIERFAYEYPQELVPPQTEESDKLEPDDFTAQDSPSPTFTPVEEVEKVGPSFPKMDEKNQFKLFQVKTIFNSVEQLNTQLKSINKTVAALGSDKNIDDILKKAGLTPDLRSQFIQLVKENPELKSLKVGDVVSFYLKQFEKNTNDQYYKAILEPINKGLEDTLIKYFDRFNISRVELENLKEKFGVDSTGVYDVLNKVIYYANNRNLLTLPEEYGHAFVELLGAVPSKKAQNPLFQYLYDNVESWDGYQRVFEDYKNLYVNEFGKPDVYRIKKEAIGQAIGLALVRNYQGTDKSKSFWAAIKEAIDYVLNLIKGVDYVSLNTAADSIARDILSNNYKKLDRLLKDTSNYNLLSYSETIKLQNQKDKGKALEFMKWFSDNGMIITGSLSYRLQGETFRPEIDALHDIDNVVPSDVHGLPMAKDLLFERIKQALDPTATGMTLRINAERLAESVPVLMEFKEQYPDTEFLYAFSSTKLDNYYITINAIWSKNKDLKERFKSYSGSFNDRLANFTEEELNQMYLFDFFLSARPSSDYITIAERDYGLTLNHFSESFYEKQTAMGRPKDAFDYQKWKAFEGTIPAPIDFKSRLTYFQIAPPSPIKPGVSELFESNPELADEVYRALAFKDISKQEELLTVEEKQIPGKEGESFSEMQRRVIQNINIKKRLELAAKNNIVQGKSYSFRELKKIFNDDKLFDNEIYQQLNTILESSNLSFKFGSLNKGKLTINGYYNSNNNSINIDTLVLQTSNLATSDFKRILLHEIIHAATFINLGENAILTNTQKTALNNLNNLIQELRKDRDFFAQYGLTNANEMLAELANSKFVDKLKNKKFNDSQNFFEKIISEIVKLLGLKTTAYDIVKESFDNLVKEYNVTTQITPEQKQQALQLYSDYLDTIFPDSKVKDILYHNSSAKFDRFRESIFGISLSYSPLKYTYGDIVYNVIVDVKNPLTAPFEGTSEEKRLYSEEYRKYNFPTLTPEGYPVYKYDASIEISSVTKEGFQIRVRTPEQTHILGNQKDIEGFKEFVSGETKKEEAPPFYEMSAEEREERFQDFYNKNQNISEDEAREYFNRCML